MPKAVAHKWEFRARFRRHGFGWKSQPAIKRIKEAVYEITGLDVLNAYSYTMKAAENARCADETRRRVHELVARESFGERFVTKVLGRHLGLS